jgi:predicted HTH transcriptional regulator
MEESEFFSGISVPRNKELMRVFKDLELVEHLGSGIARILRKYDKSIYQISNNYIRVVFPIIHKDDLMKIQ